jgi:hypothetical protein
MTVCAVLASLVPILWASGIGSDVMKPIAAPIVGGMITSTIHVLILVPVFLIVFGLLMEDNSCHGSVHPHRRQCPSLPPGIGRIAEGGLVAPGHHISMDAVGMYHIAIRSKRGS